MSATITHAGGIITPVLIDGYESERAAGSRVHRILGSANVDVTLRPAGPRRGTLRLLFDDEAMSGAAELALARGEVFTLDVAERASTQMRFVIPEGGALSRELDADTRSHWIVAAAFHEVTP